MVLRTGKKCKWKDIEVGEIYAYNGCWAVCVKINNFMGLELSNDTFDFQTLYDWGGGMVRSNKLYKLPMSIQRLWKEV